MKLVEDKGVILKDEYKALDIEERLNYWQISEDRFKLISELETEHLQKAFYYAQTKELVYHNKYNLFNELTNKIDAEAERRGLSLSDIDTDFHKNTRKHKSKIPAEQRNASRANSHKI